MQAIEARNPVFPSVTILFRPPRRDFYAFALFLSLSAEEDQGGPGGLKPEFAQDFAALNDKYKLDGGKASGVILRDDGSGEPIEFIRFNGRWYVKDDWG